MNRRVTNNLVKVMGLAVLGLGVAACANGPIQPLADIPVTIEFSGDCPTGANATLETEGRARERLLFTTNPPGKAFSITFDPFVGQPYVAPNGVLRTRPLSGRSHPRDSTRTEFKFKYSIHADGCESIDPMVIIKR